MKKLYGIFALAALIVSSTSLVGMNKKKSRVESDAEAVKTTLKAVETCTLEGLRTVDSLIRTFNNLNPVLTDAANALAILAITPQEARKLPKEAKIAFLNVFKEPATVDMSDNVLNILIDVVAARKELHSLVDAYANDNQLNVALTRIDELKALAKTTHDRELNVQ